MELGAVDRIGKLSSETYEPGVLVRRVMGREKCPQDFKGTQHTRRDHRFYRIS